jgi:Na+-translocating ferredoxin:NAD+ oxidoreductase RnfG subunit
MSRSATCSRRAGIALAAAGLLIAPGAPCAVLMTQEEALARAFPDAEVERLAEFLDEDQAKRAAELAGADLPSRLVVRYRGVRDGRDLGTAYFDTHTVRTLPETLMILVGGDGRVVRVEVLSFDEPRDYLPRSGWYSQFDGRALDEDLSLKQGIRGVTGATLSSRAATEAVRRALAIHRVLSDERDGPESKPKP